MIRLLLQCLNVRSVLILCPSSNLLYHYLKKKKYRKMNNGTLGTDRTVTRVNDIVTTLKFRNRSLSEVFIPDCLYFHLPNHIPR